MDRQQTREYNKLVKMGMPAEEARRIVLHIADSESESEAEQEIHLADLHICEDKPVAGVNPIAIIHPPKVVAKRRFFAAWGPRR
jgi:hypothetical protein